MKKTILITILTILFFSCKKEKVTYAVSITPVSTTTFTSGILDITINATGPGLVEVGTVTSTSTLPTILNGVVAKQDVDIDEETWVINSHEVPVADVLITNYVRAYVKKGDDVYYSEERSFTPDNCNITISNIDYNGGSNYGDLISYGENKYYCEDFGVFNSTPNFFRFNFNQTPKTGKYIVKDFATSDNEVSITFSPYTYDGQYTLTAIDNEEVFVSVASGKIAISFCSINFNYTGGNYFSTISGNVSEN